MKEEESFEELKQRVEVLRKICRDINPYVPITPQIKKQLASWQITEWDDPFALTNKLLVLLDGSMGELEEKKRIKKQ